MVLIFYIILILAAFAGIVVSNKLKTLNNPVMLLVVFFDVPLLINRLHLAEIQAEHWHPFTYTILIVFNIAFIVLPALFYLYFKPEVSFKKEDHFSRILYAFTNREIIIVLLVSFLSQILINKPNSGFFFPIFNLNNPELAHVKYHAVSVKYWGFLVVSFWYFSMLLGFHYFFKAKNRLVLYMLIINFCAPVFRLARIDMFVMLLIVGMLTFKHVKINWKIYAISIGIIFSFLFAGILLMWIRTKELGWDATNSISNGISFKLNGGPLDVFAFLYAYFSLSFENLNLFVVKNWEGFEYAYGAFTFRPILVGLLKLHIFYPGFPLHHYFNELRGFVSYYAMVPTCIPEFMVDFGFKLAFIPMLIYAIFSNWLYIKSQHGMFYSIVYYAFMPAFFLSSFQNLFISPRFVYVAVFLFLAIAYKKLFLRLRK